MEKISSYYMSRMLRRIVIASVFLSFNTLLVLGVYFAFIKAPETCVDLKQNQNEEGIDCGGVCADACFVVPVGRDIQVREVALVPGGEDRYDVLARVFNPNENIGATSFQYTFELLDMSGAVITSRSGTGYVLPQEIKSLIELNMDTSIMPARVTLQITDVIWEQLSGYQEKPIVNIYQKRSNLVNDGFGYYEAYGLLSNESSYDFRSVIVKIILRDASGKPLALNTHRMDTVRALESRDFKLVWPLPFSGVVTTTDMEIDADVYHSENFIQQYFSGGGAR